VSVGGIRPPYLPSLRPESRRFSAAGPRPTSPREGAFASVASRTAVGGVER
jgi:hypothetical protein